MPDDVIAHRVGDFVYVYHGLSVETERKQESSADSGWVCVYLPVNAQGDAIAAIIDEHGGLLNTTAAKLDTSLRVKENERRAARASGQSAIKPLSGPDALTNDQPFMKPNP